MIERLRRRHRHVIAALFVVLLIAATLVLTAPAPDPTLDLVPEVVSESSR